MTIIITKQKKLAEKIDIFEVNKTEPHIFS